MKTGLDSCDKCASALCEVLKSCKSTFWVQSAGSDWRDMERAASCRLCSMIWQQIPPTCGAGKSVYLRTNLPSENLGVLADIQIKVYSKPSDGARKEWESQLGNWTVKIGRNFEEDKNLLWEGSLPLYGDYCMSRANKSLRSD